MVKALKQTKEQILLQTHPLKILSNFFLRLILGLQAKFSEALRPKSRQL